MLSFSILYVSDDVYFHLFSIFVRDVGVEPLRVQLLHLEVLAAMMQTKRTMSMKKLMKKAQNSKDWMKLTNMVRSKDN